MISAQYRKSQVRPFPGEEDGEHRRNISGMKHSNPEDKLNTDQSMPANLTALTMQELMDLSQDLEVSQDVEMQNESSQLTKDDLIRKIQESKVY